VSLISQLSVKLAAKAQGRQRSWRPWVPHEDYRGFCTRALRARLASLSFAAAAFVAIPYRAAPASSCGGQVHAL